MAWAVLVAVEEGSLELDQPAGPPGATLRHVLCHASGWAFDSSDVLAAPGTRRIYSNAGYEHLAELVRDATGISFDTYLQDAVLAPLGMDRSELRGSAAKDLLSCAEDLLALAAELRTPTLIHASTAQDALSAQLPELAGVLPGWGQMDPCPWGLGPELRGDKHPHWTGSHGSAATFGHFGGAGTMLWVDPDAGITCIALCGREFGDWAVTAWPEFSDAVREAYSP